MRINRIPLKRKPVNAKCLGMYGVQKRTYRLIPACSPDQKNIVFLVVFPRSMNLSSADDDYFVFDGKNVWVCQPLFCDDNGFSFEMTFEDERWSMYVGDFENTDVHMDIDDPLTQNGVMDAIIECVNKWCTDNENK